MIWYRNKSQVVNAEICCAHLLCFSILLKYFSYGATSIAFFLYMNKVLRQTAGNRPCLSWTCFPLGGKEQRQTEGKEKLLLEPTTMRVAEALKSLLHFPCL